MRLRRRLGSLRPAAPAHAFAALAVLLAGCGGSAAQERRTLGDGSLTCDRSGNLVVYSASDGFTFHNRLTLAYDGHALIEYSDHFGPQFSLVRGRTSFTSADDELAVIRAALDESGFAALRPSYLPVVEGADLPSYWITHCGKEVYVDGFAIEEGRVPKRLLRVVERLNDLVEPRVEKALMR
jgi:hypothetical protein